jgi:hypothetical protein
MGALFANSVTLRPMGAREKRKTEELNSRQAKKKLKQLNQRN